jgi:protein SCO1/2
MIAARCLCLVFLGAALVAAGCRQAPPPKQFPITGQIVAIDDARGEVALRHEDIPGYMPGMTMTFAVPNAADRAGRRVGERISATLQVDDVRGSLVGITHVGDAPLPENTNQLAIATALLSVGDAAPDAALIDQTDRRRSFAEWQRSVTLLNFVYTRCPMPNFCPLMDQNFRTIQDAVAEDAALRGQVQLVSISIDPDHDTPAVLAAHAALRRSDAAMWTWLTGDRATVDRFAGRFGVGILREAGATDITHNLRTILIDRGGRVRAFYNGSDWTPNAVIAELRAAVTAR